MATTLTNMGISFNPVYLIRKQFGGDALLRGGLLDLKSAAEVKANQQFDGIDDIGGFLTKTTRHQQIQDSEWEELKYNGRRLTWETKFKGFLIDKEWEITQAALNDPMNPLTKMLAAKVREETYRYVLKNAAGSVTTGAPKAAGTAVTAANDGVLTVDGTNGWTRAKWQEIFENLYAQKFTLDDIRKAFAFISPTMNTAYLNIEQVMNRLYNSFNKNAVLTEKILDTISVEVVPGKTTNVSWTAADEILPVTGEVRSGVLLMPDAMAAVVEDMELFTDENPITTGGYVDERKLFVRFRIGAMRKMGQRVMLLNEQMAA